jgi:hypothetical protein
METPTMEIPISLKTTKSTVSQTPAIMMKATCLTVRYTIFTLGFTLGILLTFICDPLIALGQQQGDKKSTSEQKDVLSEELLNDLLPADNSKNNNEPTPPSNTKSDLRSSSKTLADADSPLDFIQLGMRAASTYLREGETGKTAQDVQSNVLLRLDELIQQSEQQSAQKKRKSSSRQQKRKSQNQSREQKQDESESPSPNNQSPQNQQQNSNKPDQMKNEGNSAQPGQEQGDPAQSDQQNPSDSGNLSGDNRDGSKENAAKPADPKSLQQGVWGHLPERIRQQMMSRMVERFLPQYEASIEEYFRRLSDAERESDKP